MPSQYVSPGSLGHEIFDKAAFGDIRRNDRLACLFDIMKRHPGVSFPDKFAKPADLRALYRLLSSEGVTHQSVIEAVRNHTMTPDCCLPRRCFDSSRCHGTRLLDAQFFGG